MSILSEMISVALDRVMGPVWGSGGDGVDDGPSCVYVQVCLRGWVWASASLWAHVTHNAYVCVYLGV